MVIGGNPLLSPFHLFNLKRQKHVEQQWYNPQSMTKALPKLALSACNVIYKVAPDSGFYTTIPSVNFLSQAPTTPETHGTITGADGCEFRYHSGYLSLKFSFGFSA